MLSGFGTRKSCSGGLGKEDCDVVSRLQMLFQSGYSRCIMDLAVEATVYLPWISSSKLKGV